MTLAWSSDEAEVDSIASSRRADSSLRLNSAMASSSSAPSSYRVVGSVSGRGDDGDDGDDGDAARSRVLRGKYATLPLARPYRTTSTPSSSSDGRGGGGGGGGGDDEAEADADADATRRSRPRAATRRRAEATRGAPRARHADVMPRGEV
eukprot:31010-Pelagococcus_subviridis.AAC.9